MPQTLEELVGKSILAAVHDAGLKIADIDGFAYFAGGFDTALLAETLGIPEVRFSATLTGTGGGSAGAIGLASAAIVSGQAEVVVCVGANQQGAQRFGSITAAYPATPENAFFSASGLVGPGHMFALLARRHMHLYGTTREDFAEVHLLQTNLVETTVTPHRPITTVSGFILQVTRQIGAAEKTRRSRVGFFRLGVRIAVPINTASEKLFHHVSVVLVQRSHFTDLNQPLTAQMLHCITTRQVMRQTIREQIITNENLTECGFFHTLITFHN